MNTQIRSLFSSHLILGYKQNLHSLLFGLAVEPNARKS